MQEVIKEISLNLSIRREQGDIVLIAIHYIFHEIQLIFAKRKTKKNLQL